MTRRTRKLFGLAIIALALVTLQGYAVFWYLEYDGPFFSRAGLGCTAMVAIAEIFLTAMVIAKVDELHAGMISNPHSWLGRSLRGDAPHPPPPESRSAWDGGWEDPSDAAKKMKSDR